MLPTSKCHHNNGQSQAAHHVKSVASLWQVYAELVSGGIMHRRSRIQSPLTLKSFFFIPLAKEDGETAHPTASKVAECGPTQRSTQNFLSSCSIEGTKSMKATEPKQPPCHRRRAHKGSVSKYPSKFSVKIGLYLERGGILSPRMRIKKYSQDRSPRLPALETNLLAAKSNGGGAFFSSFFILVQGSDNTAYSIKSGLTEDYVAPDDPTTQGEAGS
ncbi:uncharacterized protein B0I36DRAFT_142253 [Microdochium trichocladiopsis]|uniref:Uncharacterized protein n=1 Tax=Microdochium trichocladiopsis TaxID=1682393 RepID=A0A9P8Y2K6_9PEZI|nr:uncharacterized protein B0I36DRAFT_142253 [Microdochium trichocladiopsis]KAH7027709.1 hypothetical protein B0I36DRAFT_142253 [Microdochium trichocladiopsis]